VVRLLSKYFSRQSDSMTKFEETRIELKTKLDHFASGNAKISEIQECLEFGPRRTFEISKNQFKLNMLDSQTSYIWKISDPRTAIACLAVTGEYETLETSILAIFARQSKTIVDVGANVGYYVVELNRFLPNSGKIHAFEPVPESYEQLIQNVELNSVSTSVICNQIALSNLEGDLILFKPKNSGSSASSARNLHPREEVQEVHVVSDTLDNYIFANKLKNLDLLKIDVEGAELFVIQGGIKAITKYKPVIFAELLRKWSAQFGYHPNDVLNLLVPLGYRCYAVSEGLPEIQLITEDTVETNFVFLPSGKEIFLHDLVNEISTFS